MANINNINNKQVVLLERPTGFPVAGKHLGIKTTQVDAFLEENDILIRNLYVSADPCKSIISRIEPCGQICTSDLQRI